MAPANRGHGQPVDGTLTAPTVPVAPDPSVEAAVDDQAWREVAVRLIAAQRLMILAVVAKADMNLSAAGALELLATAQRFVEGER